LICHYRFRILLANIERLLELFARAGYLGLTDGCELGMFDRS